LRKGILNPLLLFYKNELENHTTAITKQLYTMPEREYHYCAMEVYAKFKKKHFEASDITMIKWLITTNSHWDTVDYIAKHIYGQWLLECPEIFYKSVEAFSNSSHMWLNRAAILCQLGYKQNTNKDLLFVLCEQHKDSNEFFIQKAIGWALREYGKVNPSAVLTFVGNTDLKPLSKREAIRRLV
jgi:3-methyladenine DNA glycosylase AlkD